MQRAQKSFPASTGPGPVQRQVENDEREKEQAERKVDVRPFMSSEAEPSDPHSAGTAGQNPSLQDTRTRHCREDNSRQKVEPEVGSQG